jgi:hypothetical protein
MRTAEVNGQLRKVLLWHTTVVLCLAIVLERLNRYVFHVVPLYYGLLLQGFLWTVAVALGVSCVHVVFGERAWMRWLTLAICVIAATSYVLLTAISVSDNWPNMGWNELRVPLALTYGLTFGSFAGALRAWFSHFIHLQTSPVYSTFIKKTNAVTVVVFVHGLMGNYKMTWGTFPTLLREDTDLGDLDIFLWGYPTKLVGRVPTIWEAAQQLQTELRVQLDQYTKIVLVGHSLGGLVICAMVLDAVDNHRENDLAGLRHIVT